MASLWLHYLDVVSTLAVLYRLPGKRSEPVLEEGMNLACGDA